MGSSREEPDPLRGLTEVVPPGTGMGDTGDIGVKLGAHLIPIPVGQM